MRSDQAGKNERVKRHFSALKLYRIRLGIPSFGESEKNACCRAVDSLDAESADRLAGWINDEVIAGNVRGNAIYKHLNETLDLKLRETSRRGD